MKNQTSARGKSKKYVVAGATASTALLAAHTVIPAIAFAANQYTWVQQEAINPTDGSPTTVAISAGGSHLILGGEGNTGLYISDDSGATWENVAEAADPGMMNFWTSVDISNDGQTMVAATESGYSIDDELWQGGKIVISEDAGESWSDISPEETDEWQEVALSGDGTTVAGIHDGDRDVYVSENTGDSWGSTPFEEDGGEAKTVAISDNGNKILVGGESSDYNIHLYLSENSGSSWDMIDPDPEHGKFWVVPAISADGNTIAAATRGGDDEDNESIFISENDGADWTNATPERETMSTWQDFAMSDDGSTLTAIDSTGDSDESNKMYISNDTGANWTEEEPRQGYEDGAPLIALDLNSDGTKFIVASEDEAYLNYSAESEENETTVTLDDAEGGKTIALTTPEGTTITCHSAVKESEQGVTDAAYTYPLGLVDFCFSGAEENNEVTLVFVTNLKPEDVLVRKYNPDNTEYATVDDATVTETTYEGKHALQVTYNIVDNGPLDLDPDDGEVADPVGLAVVGDDGLLADTGASTTNATLLAIGLLGIGFFFLLRRKKITE